MATGSAANRALTGVGAGLRGPHVPRILADSPAVPWFELLTDNHLAPGGAARFQALAIAERYPVTLHGVGMSLGGSDALDGEYLRRVRTLAEDTGARLVSEHLAFTSHGGWHVNDLLPLPWTEEALDHVAARVVEAQDRLGRRLLIENISAYVRFVDSTLDEVEFLASLCDRSGCGLLIDVNNVYVNACNHGFDPVDWLRRVPWHLVGEIHVAGHSVVDGLLVDTHDAPAPCDVLDLLAGLPRYAREIPVLVEWDNRLPDWPALAAEVRRVAHAWASPSAEVAA